MAYINVAEWTPDQVTDWLKGLDDTMYNYVYSFTNNEVGGQQLLNIRPYELEQLGMYSIGHQEIVLEAVENLRNFHYNLDKENLQFMALHVATAARSLHRQLATHSDTSKIETQILNDITRTIATIKPIISWLDRTPFQGQLQFNEIRRNMLRLGLEMATSAQRDRFVQNPVEQIKTTAKKLEALANYIIQDITDPMLLQPASLNLVTLKKRESELGFNIVSSYHGIHRVTDIKYNSPAHNSGKIEDGDEIVQINYQTVVGWQYKTVIMQLRESLPDVLLTLKKRPKHMKIYGQIYMQPYRLPSKKRVMGARWGENLPSPRAGFLTVPDFNLTLKMSEKTAAASAAAASIPGGASSDTDSSCSDILTPTDTKSVEKEIRLYYPKPRAMLQRRNTICGDELFAHQKNLSGAPLWHDRKVGANGDPASPSLRDKSISFGFGLEITPRPTTCIGIASGTGKFNSTVNNNNSNGNDLKGSFPELKSKETAAALRQQQNEKDAITHHADISQNPEQQQQRQQQEKSKPGVSKVVRFDANMKCESYPRALDEKYTCNVEDTILETFEPIPFADDEDEEAIEALRNTTNEASNILQVLDKVSRTASQQQTLVEAINVHAAVALRRGRLDKSHSTPAYDNSEGESDTPPAIEPRKEFLLVTPPVPPPRPKKQSELLPLEVPPPPPKPANMRVGAVAVNNVEVMLRQSAVAAATVEEILQQPQVVTECSLIVSKISKQSNVVAVAVAAASVVVVEENELHTPTKTRTLTLKKKNSLISKRRKMNLKVLGTGDIQGHLYRRTKDRRGVTFWARLYFVLLDTNLYGFRTKEALKASCLIFLPGFTVSLAKEVYSKPFAFKVYHASKTFYFATESQEALNQWIDFIRQATLQTHPGSIDSCDDINVKQLYSETDSSGEDTDTTISKNLCTPSPQGSKDAATSSSSSSNLSNSKTANTPTSSSSSSGKQSSDKRYLGSLRKLTKNSFISKSSSQNERKPSSDIPVPTEQYRSYRKVPGGSFGIQIGTNTPGYHDVSMHPFTANNTSVGGGIGNTTFVNEQNTLRKLSISSSRSSIQSYTDSNATSSLVGHTTPAPIPSTPTPIPSTPILNAPMPSTPILNAPTSPPLATVTHNVLITHIRDKPSSSSFSSSSSFDSPCIKKTFPCNFIHASNPNLVEFDFQTSKTLDYSLPKINPANSWDAHQTTQGFVTLKDLMLQKQEEEAQEMYNNRVLLGVEKKDEGRNRRNIHKRNDEKSQGCDTNQYNQHHQNEKWTQKRSLPKTPDYEISFKPDDEDIKRTRTKEGLKLRDFGYELISGDEPISKIIQNSNSCNEQQQLSDHSTWAAAMRTRQLLKTQHLLSSHKGNKKHSSNSCSGSTTSSIADFSANEKRSGGSFKKKSSKFEAVKTSSERLFQFNKHTNSGGPSHHHSVMTMTLPLNKKSTAENFSSSGGGNNGGGIKKSHTYNSELKDKASAKYEAQRKNSAPMPILAKLSFTSSNASNSASSNLNSCGSASNNNNKSVAKEKKLLGSPLLHRTIFGSHGNHGSAGLSPVTTPQTPFAGREYDQEIFSQIVFTKVPSYHSESAAKFRNLSSCNCNITAPDVVAPPPPIAAATQQTSLDQTTVEREVVKSTATPAATPEYPNMECPPVFEPEIYSLTDPNANLTFLRRRNNNSGSNGASGAGSADEEPQ